LGRDGGFFQRKDHASSGQDRQQSPRVGVIEALEAYTSEHPESIEEVLSWPPIKFEYLYRAHVRRKAIQEATAYKNSMVAGLMANTNLDDGQQTRQNILNGIEEKHLETIFTIYNGKRDEELDFSGDPLFAKVPRLDSDKKSPVPTTDTTEDLEIDQA